MKREEVVSHLKTFDPEIYNLLEEERERQRYTLSLMPNMNAMSPFAKYLEGSVLTNSIFDRRDDTPTGGLHLAGIVRQRAMDLFRCDHAIVRLGNIVAASRVVFQALLEPGDTVLSLTSGKRITSQVSRTNSRTTASSRARRRSTGAQCGRRRSA